MKKIEMELDSELRALALKSNAENERESESIVAKTTWTEYKLKQKRFQFTGREEMTTRPNNVNILKP